MTNSDWLEPLDRRIEKVRRETEAIKQANEALKRLYDNNGKGMKRLADSQQPPSPQDLESIKLPPDQKNLGAQQHRNAAG